MPRCLAAVLFVLVLASHAATASSLDEQADHADTACVAGAGQRETALRGLGAALPGSAAELCVRLAEYRDFTATCVTTLRGFLSQVSGQPGEGERTGRLYRHIFDLGPGDRDRADDWQALIERLPQDQRPGPACRTPTVSPASGR